MINTELLKLVYKFEKLGTQKLIDGAALIGKAPHIAPKAWLNTIYPSLSLKEIEVLESELSTNLPVLYRDFLLNSCNGLYILVSTFYLYGFRTQLSESLKNKK